MSKQRRVRTGKDLQQYAIPINHKPMTFKRYVLLKYPELTAPRVTKTTNKYGINFQARREISHFSYAITIVAKP